MFVEKLKEKFNINEPIFTSEILELFTKYSRAYVFRLIKKAIKNEDLIQFSTGVYYIPKKTIIGISTITAQDVVKKKYICNRGNVYGVYSGLNLKNAFSITTQMPNVLEIVSNKETTRRRCIDIEGQKFILRKSRCKIDKSNVKVYTILQLFSDMGMNVELNNRARESIVKYMKSNDITIPKLFEFTKVFPAQTTKNLINSGVLNEIA